MIRLQHQQPLEVSIQGGLPILVLTRRRGEKILIAPDIVITVVECGNGRVRLAFECPRDVPIYRDDVGGLDLETRVEIVKASQQKRRKTT